MLEEYNVGDLIRVHSKDYLEDKYEWKYDVEKDLKYLNTPATFRENMLQLEKKDNIDIVVVVNLIEMKVGKPK